MTMMLNRRRGHQTAWDEFEDGVLNKYNVVDELTGRLADEEIAAFCRGYVEFFLQRNLITLRQADEILYRVARIDWECDWFPRTWLGWPAPVLVQWPVFIKRRFPRTFG
jgi:hypothetical protein